MQLALELFERLVGRQAQNVKALDFGIEHTISLLHESSKHSNSTIDSTINSTQ